MKKILVVFFILLFNTVYSQYPKDIKANYNWRFGYDSTSRPWGCSQMNFNELEFDTVYSDIIRNLYITNSSYSDTNGNLISITNGFTIFNDDTVLINGDSINSGELFFGDWYQQGFGLLQGAIFLSDPGNPMNTYLLHKYNYYVPPNNDVAQDHFIYSKIIGGSNSYVLEKDILISNDTLDYGQLTACRHANGRDWWIIQKEFKKKRYYKFLLTPYGISVVDTQVIGVKYPLIFGQTMFTPDGTKYIQSGVDNYNGDSLIINVFNFDRCTGNFSNPVYYNFRDSFTVSSGAAVSPNSQYLYIDGRHRILQFDLNNSNWPQTKTLVATYDGFLDSTGTFRNKLNLYGCN